MIGFHIPTKNIFLLYLIVAMQTVFGEVSIETQCK